MDERQHALSAPTRRPQDIPILAATVLFSESDLSSCIEAGCNDCIVKPYTFEELEEKIQALISASSSNIQ